MFREMRRAKQALSEEECIALLKNELRGVLSVAGDDGYPYGVPLNHWYCPEDGKLYFHSGKIGHKIDAMARCDKASFCVYDQGTPEPGNWALTFRCVIVFGRVERVADPARIEEIGREISAKFTSDQAYVDGEIRKFAAATYCFSLTPEHITGKKVREA